MKKICYLLTVLLSVSCAQKESASIDIENVTEALYVIQAEINNLAIASQPQIRYVLYVDAEAKNTVAYEGEYMPSDSQESCLHIFYKHKYNFVFIPNDGAPVLVVDDFGKYMSAANLYEHETAYFFAIFREINQGYAKMKKEGQTEMSFMYDSFEIMLKLVDGKAFLKIDRILPDGSVFDPPYSEPNQIKRQMQSCEEKIAMYKNSVSTYKKVISSRQKFMNDSQLYAEYRRRLREHNADKGCVFLQYNPRLYESIKKKIDADPEIMANADQYTPENLTKAEAEIENATRQIDHTQTLIANQAKVIDSLAARLKQLQEMPI